MARHWKPAIDSNRMGTGCNKKGYIKTPEDTSNKVMHDNIPDKIAYLWFNCNCWDVASRVRIIELAWQFLPNGSRPVHIKVKILIYILLAEAQIETSCHFPFVLVHHVRQKCSPRESHSFWVRIKVFIPNTLVNISWDRSRFAITAPCWGRSIIIEITAKNIYCQRVRKEMRTKC